MTGFGTGESASGRVDLILQAQEKKGQTRGGTTVNTTIASVLAAGSLCKRSQSFLTWCNHTLVLGCRALLSGDAELTGGKPEG